MMGGAGGMGGAGMPMGGMGMPMGGMAPMGMQQVRPGPAPRG